MIVKNTSAGVVFLQFGETNKALIPGNNTIPDEEYKVLRLHITEELKSGLLAEVVGTTAVVQKEGAKKGVLEVNMDGAKDFADLTSEQIVSVLKDTVSLETLNAWLEVENRESVRVLLMNKIKEVQDFKVED